MNLSKISERIAATVERAKAEDPAQLRRQVAKLEAENARLAASRSPERVEVPVVPAATIQALASAREEATSFITQLEDLATQVHQLREVSSRFDDLLDAATREQPVATAPRIADPPASPSPRAQPVTASASMPPSEAGAEPTDVTPARQRLINALAELKSIGITAPPKTQLALRAGVSPKSSGYQNNLGGLRPRDSSTTPALASSR